MYLLFECQVFGSDLLDDGKISEEHVEKAGADDKLAGEDVLVSLQSSPKKNKLQLPG